MDSVSFKAQININRNLIQKSIVADKFFDAQKRSNLFKILAGVDTFSRMKESSIVDMVPRLDNNQLNLITIVKDKTGLVKSVINERSARKMSSDENFAQKFLNNIKNTIKNVEVAKDETSNLEEFLKNLKTIKSENFIEKISKHIFESLKKGYNPTKRIMYILKKIEEEFPNDINKISIKTERKVPKEPFKTGKCITYFSLANSQGERNIMMHTLLKDPASKLWI